MSNLLVGLRCVWWLCALLLSIGCAGARDPGQADEIVIRFVVEATEDVSGPVYVQLNEQDAQPGWVKAFRDGERIYFRERCEIEDCANPGVVCGAAPILIRRIAERGQLGFIELVWDGVTSAIDPVTGCESREPALPGEYTAEFCYSRDAVLEEEGDPALSVLGRLVDAQCRVIPFELSDGQDVVFRIPATQPDSTH